MDQPKPDHPAPPPPPPPQALHHEWRTAENSAAYLLPTLHALSTTSPHPLTLLDVGAGSGTISATLAKVLAPTGGHVTATDLNPDILPRAAALAAEAGVTNIAFRQADAYSLPFADGSFDVVHCHQVLCHLAEPWRVLAEMLRVTKPDGGVVAAREGDFQTECIWPATLGLEKFHKLVVARMEAAGGSATAGRQLLSWAMRAGVERGRITASAGTWSYSTVEEKKVWAQALVDLVRGGRVRKAALDSGHVTEEDLEEMAKAWEEWQDREDAYLGMLHGEVLIRK